MKQSSNLSKTCMGFLISILITILFTIFLIAIASSCVSYQGLDKCPSYSIEYECIEDGDNGYAYIPVKSGAVFPEVGDTVISPRSGHRLVITKITVL